MSLKAFKSKIAKINMEIAEINSDGINAMIDGCIDEQAYYNSPIKVLWILKEPYGDGDKNRKGYNVMKEFIGKDGLKGYFGTSFPTWHTIVYVSYGIFNNFCFYEEIPFITEQRSICQILKQVAVINLKKIPGETTSPKWAPIEDNYNKFKGLIQRQIEALEPDVIIGGNTLWIIDKYDENYFMDNVKFAGTLIISTNHPSIGLRSPFYIDTTIEEVKTWNGMKEYKKVDISQ